MSTKLRTLALRHQSEKNLPSTRERQSSCICIRPSDDDDSEPIGLMEFDEHKFVQVLTVDLEGRGKVVWVTAGYTGIDMLGNLGLPESIRLQMDAGELVRERSLIDQGASEGARMLILGELPGSGDTGCNYGLLRTPASIAFSSFITTSQLQIAQWNATSL